MTNGRIRQENITIVHICAPSIGAPKYIKQLLTGLKAEVVTVGVFSAHCQQGEIIQTETRENILGLNCMLDCMDLVDIYRTYYPTQQNTENPKDSTGNC